MLGIHTAVEECDAKTVAALLTDDPSLVHARLPEGVDQPLHLAAWQNCVEVTQLLLQYGADVNGIGDGGQTPLHYAARHGAVDVVPVLVEHGADIEKKDDTGCTALNIASRGRDSECHEVARLLLERRVNYDLSSAICLGDTGRVREIINNTPAQIADSPFAQDLLVDAVLMMQGLIYLAGNIGHTPDEIVEQNMDIIEKLIAAGVPVDSGTDSGWPALFYAVQLSTTHVAGLLLAHGADATRSIEGTTPLQLARRSECSQEMGTLLTQNGAQS